MLKRLPSMVLGSAMRASAALMYDLDFDLGALGVPYDPFGSVIVTNVGVLGIDQGFAPLIPSGRTAALLTVGRVRDKGDRRGWPACRAPDTDAVRQLRPSRG